MSLSHSFFSLPTISCYFICLKSLPIVWQLKRSNIHNDMFSFKPRDRIWNMNSVMWICSVMLHNKFKYYLIHGYFFFFFETCKQFHLFWIYCDNRIYMVDILSYPQSILQIVLNLSSHKWNEDKRGLNETGQIFFCIQWLGQIRCIKNNFEKSCFNLSFSMKYIYTQMKFN